MQNFGQTIQAIPTQLGIFYGQLGMVKQILEKSHLLENVLIKKEKKRKERRKQRLCHQRDKVIEYRSTLCGSVSPKRSQRA